MTVIDSRRTAGFLAILVLAVGSHVAWCQAGKELRGVPNFGRVTDTLYRGGQPTSAGFNALQALGMNIVVNLREERGEAAAEKRQVESLGIKYVAIPWSGLGEPSNSQLAEFFDLLRSNPKARIFVHCRRGADRTGVMVAAYRIAIEHKPVADAVSEMRQFHYERFWLPHLQRYVESLPGLLQKDPRFSSYTTVPASPSAAAASAASLSQKLVP